MIRRWDNRMLVKALLFQSVCILLLLHFIAFAFRCICVPLCMFLLHLSSIAHSHNFARQQLLINNFFRLLLSLTTERKSVVYIQSFCLAFILIVFIMLCVFVIWFQCVHHLISVCSLYVLHAFIIRFQSIDWEFTICSLYVQYPSCISISVWGKQTWKFLITAVHAYIGTYRL